MAMKPTFTIRLRPDLREYLERRAAKENRTLGKVVEMILEKEVEADKRARKK